MRVGIQGTRNFSDYNVFLRAMGVALSGLKNEDAEITIYSAGPHVINNMGIAFTNITERSLKGIGKKIKFIRVPPSWLEENIAEIEYFAFFSKTRESVSRLVDLAEQNDIDVGVYRY